jgi:DNA-binding protein H-NS
VTLISGAPPITPVTKFSEQMILIIMRYSQLHEMSVEQLWDLHKEVVAGLARKITLEKAKWDERLRKLNSASRTVDGSGKRERRPYPKVLAKYRNPKNPKETWAGRGKQPRWLAAQLQSGKKLDEFLIRRAS